MEGVRRPQNFTASSITADISPDDIRFRGNIAASGVFLADIGSSLPLPAIGRGRLANTSLESTVARDEDGAEIASVLTNGLHYTSAVTPAVANYRSLADGIAESLKLPDFLSPTEQQLKAIDDTATALSQLSATTADVLVHVPGDEVKFLIDKKLKEIGIQKVISFGFGKQEILSYIPAASVNSPISLVLHVAPSIQPTFVSLRPSISFAVLTSFGSNQIGSGKKGPEQIASYLAGKLAPVTTPLATLDTQIKVPIPTNNSYPLDLNKTMHDDTTGLTLDVKSTKSSINVAIPAKALMIDGDGLHVLLHVDVN